MCNIFSRQVSIRNIFLRQVSIRNIFFRQVLLFRLVSGDLVALTLYYVGRPGGRGEKVREVQQVHYHAEGLGGEHGGGGGEKGTTPTAILLYTEYIFATMYNNLCTG